MGGDTHSDYYKGETKSIQGEVMGVLENAKVTLYLDDKSEPIASASEPIASADVKADGSYVLKFSPEVEAEIVQNNYALLSAESNGTTLKSIVTFYDANNSDGYTYKDTVISSYTNAIYKVKSALQFDKNATKMLVEKFMPLYNEGQYDITKADAYAFAYNGVMDELAEHNEYDDEKTFEALEKLSILNKKNVETAKENDALNYSFAVVKKIDENVVSEEITFDINKNILTIEESTSYSLKKINIGASNYFDGAKNFEILVDNNNTLSNVNTSVFDSNQSATESNQEDSFLKFSNKTTTSIIENLRLNLDNNGSSNNKEKVFNKGTQDCTAQIFQHKAWEHWFDFTERWIEVATRKHVSLRQTDLNFFEFTPTKHKDPQRAYWVRWYVDVDNNRVKLIDTYTFYDYQNIYRNAIVAGFTSGQTNYAFDNSFDNNYRNTYEYGYNSQTGNERFVEKWVHSHTIRDFDRIVREKVGGTRTEAWQNSTYARDYAQWYRNNESIDTRKPLLLVHGWQAVKVHAERNMAILNDYEHNEYSYWHNFISYYLATPALYTRYKIYTYHYPSYKHITFNARKLKTLLTDLKNQNTTVIGKSLHTYNGLTIIGHSMGGLVARSLIEEHKALGNDAQHLAKLITLDTPHHGSQGANLYHASAWVADSWFSKKDMRTAGAVDLIWDNYDNYYKGDAFDWTVNQGNRANDNLNHREKNSRVAILNDRGFFDKYYMDKLNAISYGDNIKSRTNPFLAYLNKNFRNNWKVIAQSNGGNKYTFYVAHSSSSQLLGGQISNPLATSVAYMASTATINNFGYGSGGATPVCSSFFSWE